MHATIRFQHRAVHHTDSYTWLYAVWFVDYCGSHNMVTKDEIGFFSVKIKLVVVK